jgi:hypothetical protein
MLQDASSCGLLFGFSPFLPLPPKNYFSISQYVLISVAPGQQYLFDYARTRKITAQ